MSDATTAEKPTPEEKPPENKPEAPVEKPFTVDVLTSCTARFTHKAWNLFLTFKKEASLEQIKTVPLRASLTARTAEGAQELQGVLKENGVTEIITKDKVLDFTATFADIQHVIKLPQAYMLDVKKA